MTLKMRSILVVIVGTVLGLTVSIGSTMFTERPLVAAPVHQEINISDKNLALLAEAVERVRREYVNSIDEDQLVADAISGMLEGLDRHSRYLDHDQYEDIRIATTGNYSGIGLTVSLHTG